MRIVGRTFECSKKPVEGSVADNPGEAAEAPPFVDEETFEADGFTPQDFEKMTVDVLKKYAEEKKIDLGSAKLKTEIITVISAAVSKPETE